jgi:apolipoprotein N-acyltransferase
MRRLVALLKSELLALASFVCLGLAVLGASVTWRGESQHPEAFSWALVLIFSVFGLALGRSAVASLRKVLKASDTTSQGGEDSIASATRPRDVPRDGAKLELG